MKDIQCEIPENSLISHEIEEILRETKRIAIVVLSPKKERDSNRVARYLVKQGYEIVPVNPGQRELLGRKCYRALEEIPFQVDMVDVFLNPSRVSLVVDQAMEKGVKIIWMQLGIVHNESAEKAKKAGIRVVMDKCIKREHEKLGKQ
ncbi:CoA-binding protein [Deltaproteobacteria bacterium]|nr:CoA-binding protein [Deltaproteobacteria bacterium]